MSETKPQTVVVERNGVKKEFTPATFGKLSNSAGKTFFYPILSPATWDDDVTWYDKNNICDSVNKLNRKIFAEIFLDEDNWKDGVLQMDVYLAACADFTAGFTRLSDLEEQIGDLQDQAAALVTDPNFELDEAVGPTPEYLALSEQMKSITRLIKPLRAKKEAIEAKYKERAAKRSEAKAAKEAAEKAAKGQ